jgi:Domain of unknown function (DUF1990)
VIAPWRIVYTTDTPEQFGCAYGTLPGPEEGEEAFHVVRENGETRALRDRRPSRDQQLSWPAWAVRSVAPFSNGPPAAT